MIYFSNTNLDTPHMTFIGRWTPFHKGHAAIIAKKIKDQPNVPVLIMIRNSPNDGFSPLHRAEIIKQWIVAQKLQATIMMVPNIEGIYWGRGVGYKREYVDVDQELKDVSATTIRRSLKNNDQNWKTLIAASTMPQIHLEKISQIIDRGLVVWLTGIPCSGKTTIAEALSHELKKRFPFLKTQILDGDVVRRGPLGRNTGFSPSDRADHIRRMAELARMFANHGILVICAFVSPEMKVRQEARAIVGPDRFVEVYVKASLATCIKRDTKGMYAKAKRGEIKYFTGISADYQKPFKPNIICDTTKISAESHAQKILSYLIS